ncbi:MAG TPA: hypothetical protein VFE30_11840 [Anaeromyxobacteraceae bacterium]|jgi:OmcA/MtrC family decaheme c-type cytochrome|nr:hypothetical protein [Anaeromyxobacteraceae bacterium]
MRRISLALALMGAVAVTGCGGNKSSSSSQKGVSDGTFNINIYQAPVGGSISTADGKIKCGASSLGTPVLNAAGDLVTTPVYLTGFSTCPKQTAYPSSTTAAPVAPVVITAAPATGFVFVSWAGDCSGSALTCSVSGPGDKAPIAIFSKAGAAGHTNFLSADAHGPAFTAFMQGKTGSLNCTNCHGMTLAGQGIAPACAPCHQAANPTLAGQEMCTKCHTGTGSTNHQALYNSFKDGIDPATTKLSAQIVSVVTSAGTNAGTFKSTVTFKLAKSGAPYTTGTTLKQKTVYFVSYDSASNSFTTPPYAATADVDPTGEISGYVAGSPVNFSYGSIKLTDAATGTYTMVKDNLTADPLGAASAFVYAYFGDTVLNIPVKPTTHYTLMDNVVSVATVLNGTIPYTSTANVKGCEKCHGAPYSKHGYRQATVAGLNDFVACKACHTDQRRGTDGGWYMLVNDPLGFTVNGGTLTAAQKAQYAYTANVMQDTHNSHAFEFAYPQSMANCVTCHEDTATAGTMNVNVLKDANFNGFVCKSCHATTNTTDIAGRAPSFAGPVLGPKLSHHTFDWATGTILENGVQTACTECHGDDVVSGFVPGVHSATAIDGKGATLWGMYVPLFKDIHPGLDNTIYAADGSKYATTIKAQVDSASFVSATNKLTVNFSVTGTAASAIVKPTVVISLYGYGTKDFVVSGHGSQADGTSNLEYTEGATQRNKPTLSSNSSRLTVTPAMTVGNTSWTATADLTLWASKLADGSVTRVEIGILPSLGLDQTKAPQCDATKANYNACITMAGVATTFDLVGNAIVADAASYGKGIIDSAKCNNCHNALGTTFHTPNYGSAGVVACRLCHWVGSGGSHLEMQSRSIDSYVHAIHSFQAFDIGSINFADPVAALEYNEHIDATYPNFTTLNCESCHNPGTYDVPAANKSLPGIQSASASLTGTSRTINGVPSVVTGPGSRACGGCHRAEAINDDNAGKLGLYDDHTGGSFGYRQVPDGTVNKTTTDVWNAIITKLKTIISAP